MRNVFPELVSLIIIRTIRAKTIVANDDTQLLDDRDSYCLQQCSDQMCTKKS